jgi:hypothetical protein
VDEDAVSEDARGEGPCTPYRLVRTIGSTRRSMAAPGSLHTSKNGLDFGHIILVVGWQCQREPLHRHPTAIAHTSCDKLVPQCMNGDVVVGGIESLSGRTELVADHLNWNCHRGFAWSERRDPRGPTHGGSGRLPIIRVDSGLRPVEPGYRRCLVNQLVPRPNVYAWNAQRMSKTQIPASGEFDMDGAMIRQLLDVEDLREQPQQQTRDPDTLDYIDPDTRRST